MNVPIMADRRIFHFCSDISLKETPKPLTITFWIIDVSRLTTLSSAALITSEMAKANHNGNNVKTAVHRRKTKCEPGCAINRGRSDRCKHYSEQRAYQAFLQWIFHQSGYKQQREYADSSILKRPELKCEFCNNRRKEHQDNNAKQSPKR